MLAEEKGHETDQRLTKQSIYLSFANWVLGPWRKENGMKGQGHETDFLLLASKHPTGKR